MNWIVIIPAFNPDERLRKIVERNCELDNMVIVVDDGSQESCRPIFEGLRENCVILHHEKNQGKGAAIKTALQYVKGEMWEYSVIGLMDADGQHQPEDMDRLLMKAASHPEALILGCRTMDGNVPWRSRIGNKITARVFRMVTGVAVKDTQTGLRAFSSNLLDFMLSIPGERYEYEINVLTACARQKIPMIEAPVETIYHDKNNSCSHFRKARILSGGWNYLLNCRLVFQEKQSVRTAADYGALAVLILLCNSLLLQGFSFGLGIPLYLAKILTEGTLFVISWLVQKKLIFKMKSGVCP